MFQFALTHLMPLMTVIMITPLDDIIMIALASAVARRVRS
jgi:hypothetical protein